MARILLVGTATLDLVFELDHPPGADEEMRATSLRVCRGGNAANTAVVLAGLGHQVEFLGALADAPETAVIVNDFHAHGVAHGHCPRLPGRAPTSSIYLAAGQRSIVHYRDLPELAAEACESIALPLFDWVHFEGRHVGALGNMLRQVRCVAPRAKISLELEKPRDGLLPLAGEADWLLCGRAFAERCGQEQPASFIGWMRARAPEAFLLAAWGAEGAYGACPGVSRLYHAPAAAPARIVDTLGAGDTFNAASIDGALRGLGMDDVLQHACALAGRKCGIAGFDWQDVAKKPHPA